MDVNDKIKDFFRKSVVHYGKEVSVPSDQHFGIEEYINDPDIPDGEHRYIIQYGYPQSGCVSVNFSYSDAEGFAITGVEVFAPPEGQDFVMANYTPETELGEIGISMSFGLPIGTVEHKTPEDIERNPNAVKMLDFAINDLTQAKEHGECMVAVEKDSRTVPVTSCTRYEKETGKGMGGI